ncbi:MAG: L-lactate dehydrogenase [Anaerolineae bacterium]|nr:L-lactate dehydrogenase [Anaerolineae bacterium]
MVSAQRPKVVIIGTGMVGATFGYALLWSGLTPEIILIDVNRARAAGEAMDLSHAMPFHRPISIRAGDYADCAGAAVVAIAAGAAQRPGETRPELAQRNARVFDQIIPEVVRYAPDAILLIATNPVDSLTYYAWRLSGLPPGRVIGAGTILDTARLRYILGARFGVDPRSVHAYIVGEHGDSEVPLWSSATIAGMSIDDYCGVTGDPCLDEERERIFTQVRDAAYHIIELKGATYYAIASGMERIVESILRDQHTILTVSGLLQDCHGVSDVCISVPTVVGRRGIVRTLCVPMTLEEEARFQASARVVREVIDTLTLPQPAA